MMKSECIYITQKQRYKQILASRPDAIIKNETKFSY